MGSDSAFGEPYYGDALRQDNEQKWSALAAARREAEEALAEWRTCLSIHNDDCICGPSAMAEALRALLASEPAKAPFVSRNEEWGLRPDFTTAGVTAPPDGAEVARLTALLRECNAVCLCGCPESEHESYGEDGESCADEGHECIRVAPAVLDYVNRLRSRPLPAEGEAPAPTPVIKESLKTDVIEAAEERGREEVWGDVLDSLRAVYGKDMPYDESPCELIVDLVPPASLPPDVEAAEEALRLRGCVEKILAFLLPIDVVRLVCRTTPETRQSAATAIGNARLACDYALNGGKPENILAPERLSSARSAKGGE